MLLLTDLKKLIIILFSLLSYAGYSQCTTDVVVNYVTVLPNGDVTISWQPSPDTGIVSYDIYFPNQFVPGQNDPYGSTNSSTFTYTIPYDSIVKYNITALGVSSNCGASGGVSLVGDTYHNTIALSDSIDICSSSVILDWDAYDDFQAGPNVLYEIFMSINGAAYTSVGTTSSLTFTHTGLNKGDNYQFYVNAIEDNGAGPYSSSTNVVNVSGNFLIDPNYLYQYTATIIDSSHSQVLFYVDTAADISEYIIKRALSSTHVFTTIGTITAYPGMDPEVEFNDYNIDANNYSYYYQIYSVNTCGDLMLISNEGRTMKLMVGIDKLEGTNTLTWNWYEGWLGGINAYEIYRSESGGFGYSLVTTLPSNGESLITFEDDVSSLIDRSGEFCYKVKAIESSTPHVGPLLSAFSYSNEVCVKHDPLIYIANAFNPLDGINPTFKPSAIFFDFTTYLFVIYDRWGKKVFETVDKDEAWNGEFNNSGTNLPMGTYVYVLQLQSATGEEFIKRGTVTILR